MNTLQINVHDAIAVKDGGSLSTDWFVENALLRWTVISISAASWMIGLFPPLGPLVALVLTAVALYLSPPGRTRVQSEHTNFWGTTYVFTQPKN